MGKDFWIMKKMCNPLDDAWFVNSNKPTTAKINFNKLKSVNYKCGERVINIETDSAQFEIVDTRIEELKLRMERLEWKVQDLEERLNENA